MTVVNVTPPVISGTAQQGRTLSSSNGTWTFDLDYLTYAYQWERCDVAGASCVDIAGAINSTYQVAAADYGHTLRVRVTATENSSSTPPGLPNFSPPAFTPSRTIVCTTVALFNSAWAAIQPGDYLDVRGVTLAGEVTLSKALAGYAEVHFDAACRFTGTSAGSQLPSVWVHDTTNVRFYGGDITGSGNNGIRFDDCTNVLWWDFFVHDTAGTGVLLRGINHTTSGIDLRGTITNCGLDLSLDPHVEKGTGNHAMNMGTGTGQLVTNSRFVITVHDQPYGAGVECQGIQDSTMYLDARRVTFEAVSQTGGNAIQFWGPDTVNFSCPYLYADVMGGRAVETAGLDGSNSNIDFTFGRASNCRLSPEYAADPVISYSDCS